MELSFQMDNFFLVAYFLCGLMCTWIHESDAELICMLFFFSQTFEHIVLRFRLLYAIVLSSDVFDARVRARVCVCCSLALFSAIEHV